MARTKHSASTPQRGILAEWLQSPLLLGGAVTVGFYSVLPHVPYQQELLQRYFCSHPLAYVTATLFFSGLAILAGKAIGLIPERAAVAHDLLGNDDPAGQQADAQDSVVRIENALKTVPTRWQSTMLFRRVRDVCDYVRGRQSSEGLEEHLKYLAELTADRLHQSYALVRTITWAVPILGFLGTVIGITIAIANVTPEQLDTSLTEVTGGLAVAFDTTALALALSIVLVFGAFVVERAEEAIAVKVEEFGIKRVLCLFPPAVTSATGSPLMEAERESAQRLIEASELLIREQTQIWRDGLEQLRQRWLETLGDQQTELQQSLQQGMNATLTQHAEQLESTREAFVGALRQSTDQLQTSFSELASSQQQSAQELHSQLQTLWNEIHEQGTALHRDHAAQLRSLSTEFAERAESWQNALQESGSTAQLQLTELRQQSEVLLKVVEQEEQLSRLQQVLVENLDAVRVAETFEETLHNLSAAVHLLTTRAKNKAA